MKNIVEEHSIHEQVYIKYVIIPGTRRNLRNNDLIIAIRNSKKGGESDNVASFTLGEKIGNSSIPSGKRSKVQMGKQWEIERRLCTTRPTHAKLKKKEVKELK